MKRTLVMIAGAAICLSGCTMAPHYKRPGAPIPESWPTGAAYLAELPATGTVEAMQLGWQELYIDPKLQEIIETAFQNNRDLRTAAFRVERARALYGIQWSELLPVVDADGGGSRQQYSVDIVGPAVPRRLTQYDVNLGIAAWEVDFFGRIRSLEKQALEEYLSSEESRRSVQISLVSEVATAYLSIAAERENLNLAQSTLEAQLSVYKLVSRRYDVKLVNEIDLRRVQTQVDTARGDIAKYTQRVAQFQNELDFLAGSPVLEDLLPPDLASVSPLRDIFPGLSSEVLLRRPDIMAAEHQLKGANANIGAARAAFFPRISLTAALGSASTELSGLFTGGTATWLYGAQATMPIFDPQTWFAYRVSRADQEIALTQYEQTIQTAFREVANVLAVRGTVNQQIAAQQSMVDAAQRVYRLSEKRYTNGIDNYLSVLDAQRELYTAQQALVFLQLAKLANEVRAYAVLGGGVDYPGEAGTSLTKKLWQYFRI